MAGIDEHSASTSDGKDVHALHLNLVSHTVDNTADHGQPGSMELLDGDCCHAQGHCHLLAFTGQFTNVSIPRALSIAAAQAHAYHFLAFDTLLRPPASA